MKQEQDPRDNPRAYLYLRDHLNDHSIYESLRLIFTRDKELIRYGRRLESGRHGLMPSAEAKNCSFSHRNLIVVAPSRYLVVFDSTANTPATRLRDVR